MDVNLLELVVMFMRLVLLIAVIHHLDVLMRKLNVMIMMNVPPILVYPILVVSIIIMLLVMIVSLLLDVIRTLVLMIFVLIKDIQELNIILQLCIMMEKVLRKI